MTAFAELVSPSGDSMWLNVGCIQAFCECDTKGGPGTQIRMVGGDVLTVGLRTKEVIEAIEKAVKPSAEVLEK